jgi:hypothetical protein
VCSGCRAMRASMKGRSRYEAPRSLSCFLVALMKAVKFSLLKLSSSLVSLVMPSSSLRTSLSSFSRSALLSSGFLAASPACVNSPSPCTASSWPSSLSPCWRPTANGSSFFSHVVVRSRSFCEISPMKPCTFSS